jgi:hypothetical protein
MLMMASRAAAPSGTDTARHGRFSIQMPLLGQMGDKNPIN